MAVLYVLTTGPSPRSCTTCLDSSAAQLAEASASSKARRRLSESAVIEPGVGRS